MKNASIALNALLIIAVAILYVLHFSGGDAKPAVSEPTQTASTHPAAAPVTSTGSFTIAYIDIDSLNNQYKLVAELGKTLENRATRDEASLTADIQTLRQDAYEFQEKMQTGLVTESQMNRKSQELGEREEALKQRGEKLQQMIMESQQDIEDKIYKKLLTYTEKVKAEKGYNVIFMKQAFIPILSADAGMDITREIVDGLNAEYDAEKAKPATK